MDWGKKVQELGDILHVFSMRAVCVATPDGFNGSFGISSMVRV